MRLTFGKNPPHLIYKCFQFYCWLIFPISPCFYKIKDEANGKYLKKINESIKAHFTVCIFIVIICLKGSLRVVHNYSALALFLLFLVISLRVCDPWPWWGRLWQSSFCFPGCCQQPPRIYVFPHPSFSFQGKKIFWACAFQDVKFSVLKSSGGRICECVCVCVNVLREISGHRCKNHSRAVFFFGFILFIISAFILPLSHAFKTTVLSLCVFYVFHLP